jgi:hypothetical protein
MLGATRDDGALRDALHLGPRAVEEFRSEVRPVGPLDGAGLRVYGYLREQRNPAERLEDLAVQLSGEIHVLDGTVAELHADVVIVERFDPYDVKEHLCLLGKRVSIPLQEVTTQPAHS